VVTAASGDESLKLLTKDGIAPDAIISDFRLAGDENGMQFLGQSFIATPDGQELARAGAQPEIIYGILQLDKVSDAQNRLSYSCERYLNCDF